MTHKDNWRNEPGLESTHRYEKKFAYLPVKCSDGRKIWLNNYYKHTCVWTVGKPAEFEEQYYQHTDFIGNISEAEYIIRKLAETL